MDESPRRKMLRGDCHIGVKIICDNHNLMPIAVLMNQSFR